MDFKRKLLIAALPLAFCLSGTAYAEMTLKIAEIHPAGYPTVVAQETWARRSKKPPMVSSSSACSRAACWVRKKKSWNRSGSCRDKGKIHSLRS